MLPRSSIRVALLAAALLGSGRGVTADFTGIAIETKPNELGLSVFNVYATFDSDADQLVFVLGNIPNPLYIEIIDGSFFQSVFGGDTAPSPGVIDQFPEAAFDTFVTIGRKTSEDDFTGLTPGWPGFGPSSLAGDNLGWYATPDLPQTYAVDGQVLLGQFATADGTGVQGIVFLTYFENDVSGVQSVQFSSSPQPLGACCLPRGTCLDIEEAPCLAIQGTWQGPDTACASTGCPAPRGACCLPDFSCLDLEQAACTDAGGAWFGAFSTCVAVECSPNAACCMPDGACAPAGEAACSEMGGDWQGAASSCETAECPQPTNACCFPDASCMELPRGDCTQMGGEWQGMGAVCATTSCPMLGACCCPKGECVILLESACLVIGGEYQGDGTTCEGVTCPECPADVTLDGTVDSADVSMTWFALQLFLESGYCHGPCDLNADGLVNIVDLKAVAATVGFCGGSPECPCDLDGSGVVDVLDLVVVITAWGVCDGSCPADVDGDGQVAVTDLVTLIAEWGPCGLAAADDPCPADVDGDGDVDADDHRDVLDAFGPCVGDCPADVDRDGDVDLDDLLALVRAWNACPP